jgi:hypothetical protein
VAGVTAGLAGNDALSSALSAGGAEALAPKLASVLYGIDKKDVSTMTAEQKQTISAIISLGSTAIGAGSGSVTDMVASGEAGRVAVEENAGTVNARATPVNRYQQQLNDNARAIIARNEKNPKFRYNFISRNNNFTERDIEILEKAEAEVNGRTYIPRPSQKEMTESNNRVMESYQRVSTEEINENGEISTTEAKANVNRLGNQNKEFGSYTNTHASGKRYHGEGDRTRSQTSAKEKTNTYNDPHIATDWKSSTSRREAMKDEARRIKADGGVDNLNNYNKINSPGRKYIQQDNKGQ